jgi:hypothetical protein
MQWGHSKESIMNNDVDSQYFMVAAFYIQKYIFIEQSKWWFYKWNGIEG